MKFILFEDTEKAAPVQRDVMLPQMMPENAVQNISEQDVAVSTMADTQTLRRLSPPL